MKTTALTARIRNLGPHGSFELTLPRPGLHLLMGPPESGKSYLERALDAAAAGRKSVDLDVSRVVADVAWQLRADARAERRHGHPSLSAEERG